jgi:hypothetical protein
VLNNSKGSPLMIAKLTGPAEMVQLLESYPPGGQPPQTPQKPPTPPTPESKPSTNGEQGEAESDGGG